MSQPVSNIVSDVPDSDMDVMRRQVAEIHAAIAEVKTHLIPALESISRGGIMSLLTRR